MPKSIQDLDEAASALKAWFISQDFKPAEGVQLCEYFIASMIVENEYLGPIETKLKMMNEMVEIYIAVRKAIA